MCFHSCQNTCAEGNRHFRSQTCFANHTQFTSNKKSICERKRCCSTCGALLSGMNYDCSMRYCHTCKQNRATGHLCFMKPLKDVLRANADNVLYTGCNRRNLRDFGRVFLILNYTDITQNAYPKLNGYGDNGHRNVWASGVSTYCTPSVTSYLSNAHACARQGNALSIR